MRERFIALLCAVATLVASSPARAESGAVGADVSSSASELSTAQKGVLLGFLGATAVAVGTSLVFVVKANGAESDRKSAIEAAGGPSDGRCLSAAQCDAARSFRDEQKSAADTAVLAAGIGAAVAAVGVAIGVVFYATRDDKKTARITPSFTGAGAGGNLEVRF